MTCHRVTAVGLAVVMTFYPFALFAQTAIVPDGRTATTVTTNGNVSTVTTNTVSGPNAFNSFSSFKIGRGDTGNVILPQGTSNLINLMNSNDPAVINGVLNAYKNGQIGGNVHFASPGGFIVGRSGVVNVGSLHVTTPTREFVDGVISRSGQINQGAVNDLLAGTVPVSPDGTIRIRGRVNAVDTVRLTGQNVFVGSGRSAVNRDQAARFASSVNSRGLNSANGVFVRNGSIQIVAASDARINSRVSANARPGGEAGNVTVAAGRDIKIGPRAVITADNVVGLPGNAGNVVIRAARNIDVAPTARLSARSALGNGGNVILFADEKLTVKSGARFDVSSQEKDAGLIELSARKVFDLGDLDLNLRAPKGKGGTLLFDPDHIVVGDPSVIGAPGDAGVTMSNSFIVSAIGTAIVAGATKVIFQADDSITISANGVIDTRRLSGGFSQGNALDIELIAPNITIMDGGKILATAINTTGVGATTFTDGDVKLTAVKTHSLLSGLASASTSISVDGEITGRNITIGATSTAQSSYTTSAGGVMALVGQSLGGALLGLNGGYVAADADAKVEIKSHARITASGNVDITATATQDAQNPVIAAAITTISPVSAGVVVGQVSGTVSNTIQSGAQITAAGRIKVAAQNSATVDVSALALASTAQFIGVVSYVKADISTSAIVETGAVLSSGASVPVGSAAISVTAANYNNFSSSATGIALSNIAAQGGAGAALALSDIDTSVTARLGASLGSFANKIAGDVKVEATTYTAKNAASASMTVGTPALIGAITGAVAASSPTSAALMASIMTPMFPVDFGLKAAGALAMNNTTMSSTASIAASPSSVAPSVYAAGNVSVISTVVDDAIRNNSSASAISSDPLTGEPYSLAVAVAYGRYIHNSNAYIGQAVTINAAKIGVAATTLLPNTNTWLQWDSLGRTLGHLNSNFGVVGNIVTSYSNATADGGDTLGLAGSVSYFNVENNTTAWVSTSANLTATSPTSGPWTASTAHQTQNFSSALSVQALAQTNSIDVAGNFGALALLNGTGGGGSAAGGSLNFVDTNSNTIAGVAGSVILTSTDIAVNATTTDYFVGVSPSSGAAAGALALSGIASVALIDNKTHASISNAATVNATSVGVNATQNVSLLSIAGAVSIGAGSAVGLAVAYLGASADTVAYIGNNRTDLTSGPFSSIDLGNAVGGGSIVTDALVVQAVTAGRLTAASVAVAESDPTGSASFANKAKAMKAAFDGGGAAGGATAAATSAISNASSTTQSFSIDIAGSSSVSNLDLDTTAYIDNLIINRKTASGTGASTNVSAINNVIVDNGAGSAALNLLTLPAISAAVSGAIAIGLSDNDITAYIHNSSISNHKTVAVQALSGGQQTAIAIGLAVSTGSNGGAGSASASIGIITDSVVSYISNSLLTGVSGTTDRSIIVDAYQNTAIGIGGGSLYVNGGKAAFGVAVTYASITDPGGGKAVDAHISGSPISQYDTITVLASAASKISAGAATGGVGSNGGAGAIVVNIIDPTITAYIDSNFTTSMTVSSGVTVTAESASIGSLDTVLLNVVKNSNNNNAAEDVSGVDFTGAAYSAEPAAGSAIYAGAGLIQAGKNNVGFSLVYNTIAQTHLAYIAHVQLTVTTGDVIIAAADASHILGMTVGFGLATGQLAGVGSVVVNMIENTVIARLGSDTSNTTNSTITADDVTVMANDHAKIRGSAVLGGASTQGSAVGLALVYNEINNGVTAEVTKSKVVATGDVKVDAQSTGTISTTAVGIAASQSVGLAGSVATSILGTDVTARIIEGADVLADDNVAVLARNTNTASVFGGALALSAGAGGGGGSLVTSVISGNTEAYITGGTTKVDARGLSGSVSVNDGTLDTPFSPNANSPTDTPPDMTENQKSVRGLAVNASSHQAVVTIVASLGATAGITIMINPITNVMGGATRAYIHSAQIDTRLTATTLQPHVDVGASSMMYSNSFGFGIVAPTGSAGGGATIISTAMTRETEAYITNSTVGGAVGTVPTLDSVAVRANSVQGATSIAVGFNSGSAALNVFNADTVAYVDGGSVTATSLSVKAKNEALIATANGSGAYGSGAAIGAAFVIQVSSNRTFAYVGDALYYQGSAQTPHTTALWLSGALNIEAETKNSFKAYSIGGAVSTGGAAVAGMANIEIAENVTVAGLYDTTVQAPGGGNAGAVTIKATETVSITEIAGAIAGSSSAGVGASANVIVFKSRTTAESLNSNIRSSGLVDVDASSTKDVMSTAVTAGIGMSVGVAATVGVLIIGSNNGDAETRQQQEGQLDQGGNGTVSNVNNSTNNSQGAGAVAGGGTATPTSNASSTYDVSGVLNGGDDGVTAQISGGQVIANAVDVGATSSTKSQMFLLGAGLGGNVGVGAAIGYASVDSTVLAKIDAQVTANTITVDGTVKDASGGRTIDIQTTAGGGGLYFGANASVAVSKITNSVTAQLGGDINSSGTSPAVLVNARDTSSQRNVTGGVSGGAVAVGASVATASKSSTVSATVLDDTDIDTGSLIVSAADSGRQYAVATAMAGGIVAGTGAAATASATSAVTASIGANSTITTTGLGVLVNATGTPELRSEAIGVAVGGAAMGASVAISNASLGVTANVGNDTAFSGGVLTISAAATIPAAGNTNYASAIAGGGGTLLGIQGSYAGSINSTTVSAYGGTGVDLPSADVTIAAQNDTNQYATATGISFGFLGLGATVTEAKSNGSTTAYLGAGASTATTNLGSLSITATGNDVNVANSLAGAGGTYAGVAASATTSATANTSATLYGDATQRTLYFSGLGVQAVHTATYSANGDAFQASAIGASGGIANNTVNSTTSAQVGTNLIIHSLAADMNVIALDAVVQNSGGARAGSGGVAAGAATTSDSVVRQTVNVGIGTGTIFSLNDDPLTSLAKINIEGYATLQTVDTVSLTAGGLFAGGGGRSTMDAIADINVDIQASTLFSAGNIYIGSAAQLNANNNANANLYGLVTGAGARTNTSVKADQDVTIGATRIEGWGIINIYAGQSGDGSRFTGVTADARTVVYNNALIPITADYEGRAYAESNSTLTLGSGSQVLGVNNVFLGATHGGMIGSGKGTNYNPYLSMFSTENHDNHGDTSGTGGVVLNGLVVAGIHNQQRITIGLNGVLTLSSGDPASNNYAYGLSLQQVANPGLFNPVVSYNNQKIQYAVVASFNPYQQLVDQLVTLSGMTEAAVRVQLAAQNPDITINPANDPTGDVQRQINTIIRQAPFTTNASGPAYAFGNILVSGGNVSILADTITGSTANAIRQGTTPQGGALMCSVCARGSAAIEVDNQGLNFINMSKLTVTSVLGGQVTFTGAATDATSTGVSYRQDTANTTPTIAVLASYNAKDPNTGQGVAPNGAPLTVFPDIYFSGEVVNLNGLVRIVNQLGNVVISASMSAASLEMQVPNGTLSVVLGNGSIFNTNADVASQWAGVQYRPTDTLTAVEAAATWLGTYGNHTNGGAYLAGNGNWHPYFGYADGAGYVASPVTNYSSPNIIFTARLMALYYGNDQLYSAVFLPMGGFAQDTNVALATLAQMENTSTSNIHLAGWMRSWYRGEAYSGGDSGPFNCSGCNNYFQAVKLQSAAVQPVTANTAVNPPPIYPIIAGKAIIMSASVINVNGTISSGQSSNFSANLGANVQNRINSILNDQTQLESARAAAAAGRFVDLTPYVSSNGGDVRIGAQYNALTNQILLNGVVQGSGGYVYLNGRIISTSTTGSSQGNIVVNGGAGTINVNNQTGVALVTNTINTGVSAASVVEIVDQLKNQKTWFVYNAGAPAGQQVVTYQQAGVTGTGGYQTATPVAVSGTGGLTYSPVANQYYQWVDTATLTRSPTTLPWEYGWVFSGVSANSPTYPYSRTTSLVANVQQVANGAPTGQLQSTNFQQVVTATGQSQTRVQNTRPDRCCGTDFNGDWYQQIYYNLTLTHTNTVKASYPIGISFSGGGTSSVNVVSDASIIVNGPINNLQGATSLTTTGANSSITAGANANNPIVTGTSVTLVAPGGIGTMSRPLPVQAYGGTLTARSVDNDIAIAAIGRLTVNEVKVNTNFFNAVTGRAEPRGSVFLSATGDINSAGVFNVNNPSIVGKSITINTSGGAIGATTTVVGGVSALINLNPLVIQASPTVLANGQVDGGLLNSNSSSGAYLIQSSGDVRLGAITSNGAVYLQSTTGSILNGVTTVGLTAEQTAYLESVWANLNLVAGTGAAAVASYERMINAAYNDYWQVRNLAFVSPSVYSVTALGTTAIGAQLIAKGVLAANADLNAQAAQDAIRKEATSRLLKSEYLLGIKTAAQVNAELASQASLFGANANLASLFGATAQQVGQFQSAVSTAGLTTALTTYDTNFSYQLPTSSALYASLNTGSQWSLDQLRFTVSAGANPANAVPPPSIASLPLNISARQIMLYAPNGSVGSLAQPATFSFTSVDASSLTDANKALMVSAGPGQLTVSSVTDPNTGIISYTVSVAQQSLVIVDPLGPVAAKVRNEVYLGSATDLRLGGIPDAMFGPVTAARTAGVQTTAPQGGNVRLTAVGSILGLPGQVAISGNIGNLVLIAETGTIGSAPAAGTDPASNPNALLLALSGAAVGPLSQASAAQGIYIRQTTGDLVLGNITSGLGSSPIQLGASGSIYAVAQFTDRTVVHIAGSELDLRAGNHVSYNGGTYQPLQVKITGAVTGASTGNMAILSPSSDLTVGRSGDYGTLVSGGSLILDATTVGALAINGDVTATGAIQLLANAAVTFAPGTSGDLLVVKSNNGSVTLVAASLDMGAFSAIEAGGVISVATTGDAIVGRLASSTPYAAAGNAPSIIVAAGGVTSADILSNGDGQTNFVTTGANARLSLTASDIGTSSERVSVSSLFLTATATDGSIYLRAMPGMGATLLSAVKGTVDVTGTGSYTLDSVLASTDAGATGHFIAQTTGPGTLTVGDATGRGTVRLIGADNVTFGTLTSLELAGDPSDVLVTATAGSIQGGSITTHRQARLTAGGGITGTGTIDAPDLINLFAGGQINWETLNAGTTIDVRSTDSGARAGTAIAGGSITMRGKLDVAFDQLTTTGIPSDPGNVTLTSDTGSILGGSITSDGAVSLIAAGAIIATGTAGSGGTLNWSVISAGASMFLRSIGDAITIDDATAGGTITLWASQNVTFRSLTTTGTATDPGDIVLISDNAAITAVGIGQVNANGSVRMNAATTITGSDVNATTGSVEMTANGRIGWNSVSAGTTIDVTSANSSIEIPTIVSGGAQTLTAAQNVVFSQITATAGGADITSNTAAIIGGAVNVGGATRMAAATTISGTTVTSTAGPMTMLADGMITWNSVNAAGGSLNITSTSATMNIPSLASGGTMTLDVFQDMAITQITTTGITGDPGDVNVTSRTGRITGGTIAANGGVALDAPISITGVSATGATGAMSMITQGLIDWTTLNAGTSMDLRSVTDNVNIGTATSGGSQTIRAAQDVTFTTLATTGITGDPGDVSVTADTGKIEGPTVAANGSVSLLAATTNQGTNLTGATGSVTLRGTGVIDWDTLNAGTSIEVRSTTDNVNLGSATSGGSQTIRAALDVIFTTLATTGIAGDAGNVSVTADTGKIEGTTVAANGSVSLLAATTNIGNSLAATTGDVLLQATGLIDWNTVTAGGKVTVMSSAGSIDFGSVTSGGSQVHVALNDITFGQLEATGTPTDRGSITLNAINGDVIGTTMIARGDVGLQSLKSINLNLLQGDALTLSAPQNVNVGQLNVFSSMSLAADKINVFAIQLPSTPPVPLHVTISGFNGGTATVANVIIDPPEVIVDQLKVVDINLTVDSPAFTIVNGYVPGQLLLTTPGAIVLMNNRSPVPVGGNVNVQLYQPGGLFSLSQMQKTNSNDTYIVWYDSSVSAVTTNYYGGSFGGVSLVRTNVQDMKNGEGVDADTVEKSALLAFYLGGYVESWRLNQPIQVIGDGPAVNTQGLFTTEEPSKPKNNKSNRKNSRSTSLEGRNAVQFSSVAYGR